MRIHAFFFTTVLFVCLQVQVKAQNGIPDQELNKLQMALFEGDVEGAANLLRILIHQDTTNAQLWNIQGTLFRQSMDFPAAIKCYKKALELDQGNINYLRQLSQSLYDQEDYPICLLYTDTLLQIDSLNKSGLLLQAQTFQKLNRYLEAGNALKKLHQMDSTNTWYIRQLGILASKTDSITEALQWFTQAIQLDSMDMRSYTYLGSLFVKAEMYEEGIPVLTDAIARDSSQALIFRFRGSLSIMAADFKGGESDFKSAIELGDSIPFTFRHYGLCLFKQSRYDEALPIYEETVRMDPEDAQAWYYLGFCYKWQEDVDMGLACLKKALELSATKSIADVYDGLGQFYGLKRDYEKSIHNYSRAYEWNPENPIPLAQLGMLVEQSGGKKEHAKNYYQAFLDKANRDVKDLYLIEYVSNRIKVINEKLFMEGKLER